MKNIELVFLEIKVNQFIHSDIYKNELSVLESYFTVKGVLHSIKLNFEGLLDYCSLFYKNTNPNRSLRKFSEEISFSSRLQFNDESFHAAKNNLALWETEGEKLIEGNLFTDKQYFHNIRDMGYQFLRNQNCNFIISIDFPLKGYSMGDDESKYFEELSEWFDNDTKIYIDNISFSLMSE